MKESRGPIRVGFIIDALRPGAGTENQLILILRSLDRAKIIPSVCCLRDEPGVVVAEDVRCEVELVGTRKVLSFQGFHGLRKIRNWIRRSRLDFLVTFFGDSNVLGTLAGSICGVPVISSRRNIGTGYWHTWRAVQTLRLLNRLTLAFLANSEAARISTVETEGVESDRITVVPNAVDLRRFRQRKGSEDRKEDRMALGLPRDGLLIGCVANLRPIKNLPFLIKAFAKSSNLVSEDFQLLLIGSGPDEQELRNLADTLGVAPRVHFLGSRKDVPTILEHLSLGVLTSSVESSPNSIYEYMASSLPVVATAVGGVPELVDHGRTGLLVSSRNPDDFATAMSSLVMSMDDRTRMGEAGRKRIEAEFALLPICETWVEFFVRMSSKTRRPVR